MSQTLADIAKKWQEVNKSKIEGYNQHVANNGLPFDDELLWLSR
jgi:post-segregation antitoxin (ccd killing protein)